MKFAIYGENVTVNDKMREKIENRLSELNKYVVIDEEQSAKVTVKIYGSALKVEVNVPTKVGLMRSEVVHEDFSTAVDLAIDKLEDQIRRQKGRLSRRHKDSLAENFYEESGETDDTPVRTKTVSMLDSIPAIMSVSIRSPIKAISSLWQLIFLRPWRNINGFGLPTKYAFLPVAISIGAINEPVAGIIPRSVGPVMSGLAPISLAPRFTSSMAFSIFSKL